MTVSGVNGSFASISAGDHHSCAVTTTGQGYCWGWNGNGQLGTGGFAMALTPAPVAGGHTWARIDAGPQHSCGVTTGGDAYCWGSSASGRLGSVGSATYSAAAPTLVLGGRRYARISAGGRHGCAIASDRQSIYCWGDTSHGQLGHGAHGAYWTAQPQLVSAP